MNKTPKEEQSARPEQLATDDTFTVSGEHYCESIFEFVKGKKFKAIYKGRWAVQETKTKRNVFELTEDGAVKDNLKLMKKLVDEKKVWSAVTDPDMDRKTYPHTWKTAVWMTNKDESTLAKDSEYNIELTGYQLVKNVENPKWVHGLEITYKTVVPALAKKPDDVPGKVYCESLFEFVKGKKFKAIYKGRQAVHESGPELNVFELTDDGAVKDNLKLMKKFLDAKKVWSAVTDPDMDGETDSNPWKTAVWMTHTDESKFEKESEYNIELTGCQLVKYDEKAKWGHGLEITYKTVD